MLNQKNSNKNKLHSS